MKLFLPLICCVLAAPASPATVILQGAGSSRTVAVTFDAGADRGYALSILRTLERNQVHATFGMTGKWAEANPDLVRRMARDRDAFMNHTYDHSSFTGLSTHLAALTAAQRAREIVQTDRIIVRLTGHTSRPYFRPPFGDYDAATLSQIGTLGYRYMVMWTVDSLGWAHLPASAIVLRCLSRLKPGTIYLMHVGIQSQDALALQSLLSSFRHQGYRLVTIPQMAAGR